MIQHGGVHAPVCCGAFVWVKVGLSWGLSVPHSIFQRKAMKRRVFCSPHVLRQFFLLEETSDSCSLFMQFCHSLHFSTYVFRCQSLMAELQHVTIQMIKMNCIIQQKSPVMACSFLPFRPPQRRKNLTASKITISSLLRHSATLYNFSQMKNLCNSSEDGDD